jgi:RHS repeat-associated protein
LVVSYGAGGNGIVQGLETPLVTQPRSDTRYYFLKDHLGSVRVTVDVSGNVTSYDDFYPFGMTMDGRSGNIGSGDARYKYTTKERDAESGYDYFGARYYDSRIGRWMAVDPMAEKYPGVGPFVYAKDNPVRLFDSDGGIVHEAKSLRDNAQYQAGKQLYLATSLGAKQWERLDKNQNIFVLFLPVTDLNSNGDGGVRGQTVWDYRTREPNYEPLQVDGESIDPTGKTLVKVWFDYRTFEMDVVSVARVIYHEGKAHIEYFLDAGDIMGVTQTGDQQHEQYGEKFVNRKPRRKSDADLFYRQAWEAFNQRGDQKRDNETSSGRRKGYSAATMSGEEP